VKKEICDFCCAEKSAKILKATAFFFFLSFEENFLFRFFQSEEKSSQLISLFCFFSSTTIYTHTRFAAFQQNTTVKAFCVREKERYREKCVGCFEDDDDENAFFPFSSFLSLRSLLDDDGFDDGGEEDDDGISLFSRVRAVRVAVGNDRTGRRQKRGVLRSERCFVDPENE
jgi:hypothetical protein